MRVTDLDGMTIDRALAAVGLSTYRLGLTPQTSQNDRRTCVHVLPAKVFRRVFGFRCDGVASECCRVLLPDWLETDTIPGVLAHEACHTRQWWYNGETYHLRTKLAQLKAYFFSETEVEAYLTGLLAFRVLHPECDFAQYCEMVGVRDRVCPGPRVKNKRSTALFHQYDEIIWSQSDALLETTPTGPEDYDGLSEVSRRRELAIPKVQRRLLELWWHGRKPAHLWLKGDPEPELFSRGLPVFFMEDATAGVWEMLTLERALGRVGDVGVRLRHRPGQTLPAKYDHTYWDNAPALEEFMRGRLREIIPATDPIRVIAIPDGVGLRSYFYPMSPSGRRRRVVNGFTGETKEV